MSLLTFNLCTMKLSGSMVHFRHLEKDPVVPLVKNTFSCRYRIIESFDAV